MAYEDWVKSQPKRYGSKPYPAVEDNDIYGWVGDGWYYMDENGMLVGGRHDTKEKAKENKDKILAKRSEMKDKLDAKVAAREARFALNVNNKKK